MKINKYAGCLFAFVLAFAASTATASETLFPFNADGIGEASYPYFLDFDEHVTLQQNGVGADTYWTLNGSGSNTSFWGGLFNFVSLGDESVSYQANFNSAGELITSWGGTTLTNFLEISGSLPAGAFGGTSWDAQPDQLLLSAELTDVGTWGGVAVGFETLFTGGWAAENTGLTGGSTGENLWLFGLGSFQKLVDALDGDAKGSLNDLFKGKKTSISFDGIVSIASVPLPGAVWLFGAGLIALVAGRSKAGGPLRIAA